MKKVSEGSVTLEACIFVLFFMVIMFVMMSLFIMFCAHGMIAHTILQTTESLSIDAYAIEKIFDTTTDRQQNHLDTPRQFIAKLINTNILGRADNANQSSFFVTDEKWYEDYNQPGYVKPDGYVHEDPMSIIGGTAGSAVADTVRNRFIGYLTGGDGPEADKLLKSVYVVDGLAGLDFSESYVQNGDLHVVLHYKLHYMMGEHVIPAVDIVQKSVAKLWK